MVLARRRRRCQGEVVERRRSAIGPRLTDRFREVFFRVGQICVYFVLVLFCYIDIRLFFFLTPKCATCFHYLDGKDSLLYNLCNLSLCQEFGRIFVQNFQSCHECREIVNKNSLSFKIYANNN